MTVDDLRERIEVFLARAVASEHEDHGPVVCVQCLRDVLDYIPDPERGR